MEFLAIHTINLQELAQVKQFYADITSDLRKKGIHQWDYFYPNHFVIKNDLKNGTLFGVKEEHHLIGTIVLNMNQSKQYLKLHWEEQSGRPFIIHRLAVHPLHQGKGIGKKLLNFAKEYAFKKGYTSIRLDVYAQNPEAVGMYERAGYQIRGTVKFPLRKVPYLCFEKIISTIN
ncbi:GNAT family N-acetyltransferase [Pseudobacillus wudalianchiensis]|uniref:GCN5 family acetyltransferase n=1 Tax=Pseudobacillus wudalianchiensis TaxID=1743143 RepID=A0A1B9AN83_9BACI|nr:GNAT family N-acetyltransferase [Bacillus wudalianchiensis]OCA85302.1 GCN5 family acetyltransferase [Bacillus wudalianchiensis]